MSKTDLIEKEGQILEKMLRIHCRAKHGSPGELCPECTQLLDYALTRLKACTFLPDKPVCGKCPIHCYREPQRSRVRQAMKFAGPRMLFADPRAAIEHLAGRMRRPSAKVRAVALRQRERLKIDA